jgi:hypothetical protein
MNYDYQKHAQPSYILYIWHHIYKALSVAILIKPI